jgi:hypothetical protein
MYVTTPAKELSMVTKAEGHGGRKLPAALSHLTELAHWVVWQRELRDGRWTKPPRQSRHPERYAKVTDPTTWSTWAAAEAARAKLRGPAGSQLHGPWGGCGFVLFGTDVAGIDLDHCIDDEGSISAWAMDIIRRSNSYAEVSPSRPLPTFSRSGVRPTPRFCAGCCAGVPRDRWRAARRLCPRHQFRDSRCRHAEQRPHQLEMDVAVGEVFARHDRAEHASAAVAAVAGNGAHHQQTEGLRRSQTMGMNGGCDG